MDELQIPDTSNIKPEPQPKTSEEPQAGSNTTPQNPGMPTPEGTKTYVDEPKEIDPKTMEEAIGGSHGNDINPNQVNTAINKGLKSGGKVWLWVTVAGVIATVIIATVGAIYFFNVKGADNKTATNNETSQNSKSSSDLSISSEGFEKNNIKYMRIVVKNDSVNYYRGFSFGYISKTSTDGEETNEILISNNRSEYIFMPKSTYIYIAELNDDEQFIKATTSFESKTSSFSPTWKLSDLVPIKDPKNGLQTITPTVTNTGSENLFGTFHFTYFSADGKACDTAASTMLPSYVEPGKTSKIIFIYSTFDNECKPATFQQSVVSITR